MSVSKNSEAKADIEGILNEIAILKDIKNYELKPSLEAEVGNGFVSQLYKGEIINKDTGEIIHAAIKIAPKWEMDFSKIFLNEKNFYEKVIPALRTLQDEANLSNPFDNTPEFFAAGIETKKEYIALEDLKPKGYVLHDKKKIFSKEQLDLIFRTYGKFHALSFVLRKQNFEKYKQIHQDYTDVFNVFVETSSQLFVNAFAAAVNSLSPDSAVYEEAKDLPKNGKATILKSFIYDGNYRCSTHGDCWSNNMLFKYSDSGKLENLKLIDFQIARDGTPVHDLSYFFYAGAGKTDLDNLEDYLKIYHSSLSEVIINLGENPEEILPFETLIKEWKENALMGVLLGIYLWLMKLIPKEELADDSKESDAASKKDTKIDIEEASKRFAERMAAVFKTDAYREITKNLLTHAFKYGILRKDKIVYGDDAILEKAVSHS